MAMNRAKCLIIGSLVVCSIGLLFYILGFSTGHWLEADDRFLTSSHFVRLGLWEACFEQWSYYKDYTGKQYNGCWWIFSYEYRPIWQWLNPPWFLGIQVMMTITLILELVCELILVMFIIGCCPGTKSFMALFALSGMQLLAGLLTAICTIMFGTKSVVDRQWLEKPDQNYLSWSFGLIVLSGFCQLFGGMCTVVAALQVRIEDQKNRAKERYGGYVLSAPPPHY